MKVVGHSYTTNSKGVILSTLYGLCEFDAYHKNPEMGRGCVGSKVETVYVGEIDCSDVEVGMEIEVVYDKAIQTSKGLIQPVKRIEVVE